MNFIYNPLYKQGYQVDTNTAVVSFKEAVSTYANLPQVGNTINDARVTEDTNHLYIWNGTSWVDQGTPLSMTWAMIDGKPTSTPSEIDAAVALAATALQNTVIDTDPTLAADSDTLVASQKAVKAYVAAHGGGSLHFGTLPPIFVNNQHALLGGLVVGDVYRTGNAIDCLCVVH